MEDGNNENKQYIQKTGLGILCFGYVCAAKLRKECNLLEMSVG